MDIKEFARMGGVARSKKLTPKERSMIAQKASRARWDKKIKQSNKTK